VVRALLIVALLFGVAAAKAGKTAPADPAKKKHPRAWPAPAAGPTMSGDPEIIFTFDDGPNPQTTPAVLDTLAKHHIHAVFFLVGEMAANKKAQPIIQRIIREGHIIANHTMTHQDLCRIKDETRAEREIDDGKSTIEEASGIHVLWFRTPYGVRCERVDELLAARKLNHFHWDLDPQEWKHGNVKKTFDYVTKQLNMMQGRNVLLMHDIKKATVEALPQILDWLEAENARRKTIHKRRIRIIQSYELAAERLPPGLTDWFGEVASPAPLAGALASVIP
jgi:peptidoglycan/xylan/chitin deacetylase (PgdA/CDA1 family)